MVESDVYRFVKEAVKSVVEDGERMKTIFSKTDWFREEKKKQFLFLLFHNSHFSSLIRREDATTKGKVFYILQG